MRSRAASRALAPLAGKWRRWRRFWPFRKSGRACLGDDFLLVEHARSRGDEHLFFYPFAGRLVHEGLAALVAFRISRDTGIAIVTTQNDYGFSLTAKRGLVLDAEILRRHLSGEDLLADLVACMNTAELARRQFREIARISGLILQTPPGQKGRSQRELQSSASLLYEVLHRYDSGNLLLVQAQREILEKQLELTRLATVIRRLESIPMHLVEIENLTPMAFPLWADRLSATLSPGDAATRLEAMLRTLNVAASAISHAHS